MLGLLGWTALSKAACCFFRITSANFCLTTLLATAPVGGGHAWDWSGWTGGPACLHIFCHCLSTPLVQYKVSQDFSGKSQPRGPIRHHPHFYPRYIHRQSPASRGRPALASLHPSPSVPRWAGHGHRREASILTSLALVLMEKLPQLLLLLPHWQLGHRRVHGELWAGLAAQEGARS